MISTNCLFSPGVRPNAKSMNEKSARIRWREKTMDDFSKNQFFSSKHSRVKSQSRVILLRWCCTTTRFSKSSTIPLWIVGNKVSLQAWATWSFISPQKPCRDCIDFDASFKAVPHFQIQGLCLPIRIGGNIRLRGKCQAMVNMRPGETAKPVIR